MDRPSVLAAPSRSHLPGSALPLLLLLVAALPACASPASAVERRRTADRLMEQGHGHAADGKNAAAHKAYAGAHEAYAEAERLAGEVSATTRSKSAVAWREAGEAARAAAPHAALAAASSSYRVALSHWGRGDQAYDAGNFSGALEAYQLAEAAYVDEERYLLDARRRLRAAGPAASEGSDLSVASVEDDLAKNRDERTNLRRNIEMASRATSARATAHRDVVWHDFWGGVGHAGLVVLDFTARAAIVTLHLLAEPVIWECLFGIVRVACAFR